MVVVVEDMRMLYTYTWTSWTLVVVDGRLPVGGHDVIQRRSNHGNEYST